MFEYAIRASTTSSLAADRPVSESRWPVSAAGSTGLPFSVTEISSAGSKSANVAPPTSAPNRITVRDRNVSAPPVRSRSRS